MTNQGKLILNARLKLNMTQGEVAKQLKLNTQNVSNMERGTCLIYFTVIKKLCKVLDIPLTNMRKALVCDYLENLNEVLK